MTIIMCRALYSLWYSSPMLVACDRGHLERYVCHYEPLIVISLWVVYIYTVRDRELCTCYR